MELLQLTLRVVFDPLQSVFCLHPKLGVGQSRCIAWCSAARIIKHKRVRNQHLFVPQPRINNPVPRSAYKVNLKSRYTPLSRNPREPHRPDRQQTHVPSSPALEHSVPCLSLFFRNFFFRPYEDHAAGLLHRRSVPSAEHVERIEHGELRTVKEQRSKRSARSKSCRVNIQRQGKNDATKDHILALRLPDHASLPRPL